LMPGKFSGCRAGGKEPAQPFINIASDLIWQCSLLKQNSTLQSATT